MLKHATLNHVALTIIGSLVATALVFRVPAIKKIVIGTTTTAS